MIASKTEKLKLLSKAHILQNYLIDIDFFEAILRFICDKKWCITNTISIPIRIIFDEEEITSNDKIYIFIDNCSINMPKVRTFYSADDHRNTEVSVNKLISFPYADIIEEYNLENHLLRESDNPDNNEWMYCINSLEDEYLLFIRHAAYTRKYILTLTNKVDDKNEK